MTTEQEPRASGILDRKDQEVAQELFDYVLNHGGEVRDESDGITVVTVTGRRSRDRSIEVYRFGEDVGEIVLRFRRGRRSWQDNGSTGLAGIFSELSKVDPDPFHPTPEQRDRILRRVADRFLPSKPQS